MAASSNTACTSATGGVPVNLTGSPSGGTFVGTGVSGSSFLPPATAGTYTVNYSYTDPVTGCSNYANTNIVVNVCTGINNTSVALFGIQVYPNPVTDFLTIENNTSEVLSVNVYDVSGKLIISKSLNQPIESIDVSQLAKGTYLVELLNATNRISKTHLIKQ
jgi:hypothetical protein